MTHHTRRLVGCIEVHQVSLTASELGSSGSNGDFVSFYLTSLAAIDRRSWGQRWSLLIAFADECGNLLFLWAESVLGSRGRVDGEKVDGVGLSTDRQVSQVARDQGSEGQA